MATTTPVGFLAILQQSNEDRIKRLQASMVNESLRLRAYSKPNTNCQCCCFDCLCRADLVHPLSDDERVINLVIGYINKHSPPYLVPKLVYHLCMDYLGGPRSFNYSDQLMSNTEIRKQRRIHWTLQCRRVCCSLDTCYWPLIICSFFMITTCLFGKDIAGIMFTTYTQDTCNQVQGINMEQFKVFGSQTYILTENQWLFIGSLSHIAFVFLSGCCGCCGCHRGVGASALVRCCMYCWIVLYAGFYILWTAIGYYYYSLLVPIHNAECKQFVLAWCILQDIQILLGVWWTWRYIKRRREQEMFGDYYLLLDE